MIQGNIEANVPDRKCDLKIGVKCEGISTEYLAAKTQTGKDNIADKACCAFKDMRERLQLLGEANKYPQKDPFYALSSGVVEVQCTVDACEIPESVASRCESTPSLSSNGAVSTNSNDEGLSDVHLTGSALMESSTLQSNSAGVVDEGTLYCSHFGSDNVGDNCRSEKSVASIVDRNLHLSSDLTMENTDYSAPHESLLLGQVRLDCTNGPPAGMWMLPEEVLTLDSTKVCPVTAEAVASCSACNAEPGSKESFDGGKCGKYERFLFTNCALLESEQRAIASVMVRLLQKQQQSPKYGKNAKCSTGERSHRFSPVVSVQPQWLEHVVLRCLHSCAFDEEKTLDLLSSMREFRETQLPVFESEVYELLRSSACYWHGRDSHLRPLLVVSLQRLQQLQRSELTAIKIPRLIIFCLEYFLRYLCVAGRVESWSVLCDCSGTSFTSFPLQLLLRLMNILQGAYRGRLYRFYVLHAPRLFSTLSRPLLAALPTSSVKKLIVFRSMEEWLEERGRIFARHQLETRFGGTQPDITENCYPFRFFPGPFDPGTPSIAIRWDSDSSLHLCLPRHIHTGYSLHESIVLLDMPHGNSKERMKSGHVSSSDVFGCGFPTGQNKGANEHRCHDYASCCSNDSTFENSKSYSTGYILGIPFTVRFAAWLHALPYLLLSEKVSLWIENQIRRREALCGSAGIAEVTGLGTSVYIDKQRARKTITKRGNSRARQPTSVNSVLSNESSEVPVISVQIDKIRRDASSVSFFGSYVTDASESVSGVTDQKKDALDKATCTASGMLNINSQGNREISERTEFEYIERTHVLDEDYVAFPAETNSRAYSIVQEHSSPSDAPLSPDQQKEVSLVQDVEKLSYSLSEILNVDVDGIRIVDKCVNDDSPQSLEIGRAGLEYSEVAAGLPDRVQQQHMENIVGGEGNFSCLNEHHLQGSACIINKNVDFHHPAACTGGLLLSGQSEYLVFERSNRDAKGPGVAEYLPDSVSIPRKFGDFCSSVRNHEQTWMESNHHDYTDSEVFKRFDYFLPSNDSNCISGRGRKGKFDISTLKQAEFRHPDVDTKENSCPGRFGDMRRVAFLPDNGTVSDLNGTKSLSGAQIMNQHQILGFRR